VSRGLDVDVHGGEGLMPGSRERFLRRDWSRRLGRGWFVVRGGEAVDGCRGGRDGLVARD